MNRDDSSFRGWSAAVFYLIALASTVVLGCADTRAKQDRTWISGQLEERVGHTLSEGEQTSARRELPPDIDVTDGISEEEAIAIALWNNAGFQQALTSLDFTHADLIAAGLLSNPTLSVLFPAGPKQLEFAVNFPLEALWLRPRRVAFATLEAERVAHSLVQNGLDLVRDVKLAYTELQFARDREQLSREGAELQQQISGIAEARIAAGDLSELEAAAARLDLARLREETRRSRNEANLADERLRQVTALTAVNGTNQFLALSDVPQLKMSMQDAERRAYASRPDLRAAELAVEAAGKRIGLAQTEIYTLTGVLDANDTDTGLDVGPGIQLPIPVFNRNQGGIARAKAELERTSWAYLAVKDSIQHEVRQSHAKYTQAVEELASWQKHVVPAAEEGVARFQKAFEIGDVSLLAVHEQTRQLITARTRQAELVAAARRSLAEFERNIGSRIQ